MPFNSDPVFAIFPRRQEKTRPRWPAMGGKGQALAAAAYAIRPVHADVPVAAKLPGRRRGSVAARPPDTNHFLPRFA